MENREIRMGFEDDEFYENEGQKIKMNAIIIHIKASKPSKTIYQ